MMKKMKEKSLRRSRKPLLSVEMVQKRLERSTRLLNYQKKKVKSLFIRIENIHS